LFPEVGKWKVPLSAFSSWALRPSRVKNAYSMSFEESEDKLIEHMESYGLKPREYIASGNLVIKRFDPVKFQESSRHFWRRQGGASR